MTFDPNTRPEFDPNNRLTFRSWGTKKENGKKVLGVVIALIALATAAMLIAG